MIIKDVLRDMVNTTSAIGFEVVVAGRNEEGQMTLDAVTADRRVIMKAVVKEDVTDMEGIDTFGIGTLPMLQGLLNLNTFKTESTKIQPVLVNDELQKFEFVSDDASTNFLVMAKNALPKQPKFLNKPFDAQVTPSAAKVQELKSYAGVFKSISENVVPYTEDDHLRFKVGNASKSSHGGSISFAVCKEEVPESYAYSVERIMQTLTRINSCKECTMSIANSGILAVTVDTGICVYNFYLMGQ